jgi:hypothetical protein
MEINIAVRDWSDTKKMEEVVSLALDELDMRASIGFSMGMRTSQSCRAELPAIFIDDKLVFEGGIPEKEKFKQLLKLIYQE